MTASRHLVSFIVLGVISFELFLGLFFTTTPLRGQIVLSDYNAAHPLKIMAIGDSITNDCSYTSQPDWA